MADVRPIEDRFTGRPVLEGAGVHLRRVFGFDEVPRFDPFLLFDDFRSDRPEHYRRGFPWHPHRGIETITYVLAGDVEHGDSLGNQGVIRSGDVQWMTAGRGIVHQEMPKGDGQGRMHGFQLWANLPAAQKMMPPRYRDVAAGTIPEVTLDQGAVVRIIAGEAGGRQGPVQDIVTDPAFFDVTVPSDGHFHFPTDRNRRAFAYVIDGRGCLAPGTEAVEDGTAVLFGPGDAVEAEPVNGSFRFLFVTGRPLNEPVAWRGPIVMNTDAELDQAFQDYRQGRFLEEAHDGPS